LSYEPGANTFRNSSILRGLSRASRSFSFHSEWRRPVTASSTNSSSVTGFSSTFSPTPGLGC